MLDDFPNAVGENIANVLSFEEPFPQTSYLDYKYVPVAFKNIQKSYLPPEFRNTFALKKRTNKSPKRV